MDCPVCDNVMITLELQGVEIDHCLDCGGIWLDTGELELLLNNSQKAAALLESFKINTETSEKLRKCPICLKKMQKILVGSESPALLIDKCKKGDGLWFDKGELDDIVKRAKLDEENKIQKLLVDMFSSE
ncbi:MAG: zf-TFIIB domain-containing protein [Planctomycetota bacterium]|jgi:Zn-finger nucleic acid-binding protein